MSTELYLYRLYFYYSQERVDEFGRPCNGLRTCGRDGAE